MRKALAPVLALSVVAMAACTRGTGTGAAEDDQTGVAGWDRIVSRPASDQAAGADRASCKFARGALPAETVGRELPVDRDIPIKTIVVLMQENRSFDSYFGRLGHYTGRTDIESPPPGASNPEDVNEPHSPRHPFTHAPRLCMPDTSHEWGGAHFEYHDGKMDGFFQANQGYIDPNEPGQVPPSTGTGDRALWWYDERDIPFYYELASTFTIGDHYHSSLLGPTYPNRDYLYAATSLGVTDSSSPDLSAYPYPQYDLTIFDELERRKISWAIYVDGFPPVPRVGSLLGVGVAFRWPAGHIDSLSTFYDQARSGTLPQVVFIDGSITEDVNGNDEHPPADIQLGQKFTSDVVHSLLASPQWKELALFITYDEHGGLYDHVPPPAACAPDGVQPVLSGRDAPFPGGFDRLGVRVPFIVVSPFAKKGYVSHAVYDHTSITRFIEAKFKLPALTKRDANATPPYDAFDFAHPPFLTPPPIRAAEVDAAKLAECRSLFGSLLDGAGGGGQ